MVRKNIEIKARCADPDAVEQQLAQRGVHRVEQVRQVDTYFSVPHGRLKLRETDGAEAKLIQYDRPNETAMHPSDYVISPVTAPDSLKEALARALGIRAIVEKQRELYLWGHTRIHLDEVAGLGSFLELETVITGQTQEEAEQECRAVETALGIKEGDLIAGSYADLIQEQAVRLSPDYQRRVIP
jgi:predicted adenylyl cyclase CyaB